MEIEVFAKMEDVMENLRNKPFEPIKYQLFLTRRNAYLCLGYRYFVYGTRLMTACTEESELLKKCVLCKTRNKAKRVVSYNRKYGFEEQNNPDQFEVDGIDLVIVEPTEFSLNISEVDFWGKNTPKK